MKYALIGCNRISESHLVAALDNGLEIAALCDLFEENIQNLLSICGLEDNADIKRYKDYREMLQDPEIDLVAIATPSDLHARMALDCIDAKKHLIIEKPMALSIDEADEIIRRAEEAGVTVSACHQNRFNPAVQMLRGALEEGRFGKLSHGSVNIRWHRGEDYYSLAAWRGTWAKDGGCLMNQCVHGIDLLIWMMGGKVTSVYAQTRQRFHEAIEAEDVGQAVLTFDSGAIATIEGTTNVFPENLEETLYIFGESGTVVIGGESANEIKTWQFADVKAGDEEKVGFIEEVTDVYGNGHKLLYADVIAAISEGRKPYVDAVDGRAALEIVLAMYKSQKTGLPVQLPLKNFSTLDMQGEFS
ncbi:MAG: Gfo/Idh/MocA family oxidoreductase [Coriobacteriia bacterium]|nr:Gfo/Idh/MocA family oxidoreductase [Coriobacteriia bacterium]MCL2750879.1 Gfo/Idh/MocA family oxidoreductase [Coriobacteriia bacterium]